MKLTEHTTESTHQVQRHSLFENWGSREQQICQQKNKDWFRHAKIMFNSKYWRLSWIDFLLIKTLQIIQFLHHSHKQNYWMLFFNCCVWSSQSQLNDTWALKRGIIYQIESNNVNGAMGQYAYNTQLRLQYWWKGYKLNVYEFPLHSIFVLKNRQNTFTRMF